MEYKLVALDMDGTLLNEEQEISKENLETIKELKGRGVEFVIVTGRPDVMVKKYLEILELENPVLAANGATVRNVFTGDVYSVKEIEKKTVLELYNFFTERGLFPRFCCLGGVYTFNPNEFVEGVNPFAHMSKRLASHMNFTIIENIETIMDNKTKVVNVMFPSMDEEILLSIQNEVKNISGVDVLRGSKITLDIIKENVSKGETLLEYAETLGIKSHEIIAIGDGENDISMLSVVGFPVTLENGDERLKKIAHMITDSNENSGVSKALKKIFKI
ncbi:MAG: HAD family hydrolase [Cetobacterium sp.]